MSNVEYEVEKSTWQGRTDANVNSGGKCIGVVTEMSGGTYSALAFKSSRVKSLSSKSGFKYAPETSLGTHFETIEDAAKAIAGVFA